LNWAELPKM